MRRYVLSNLTLEENSVTGMSAQGKWKYLAVPIVVLVVVGALGYQQYNSRPISNAVSSTVTTASTKPTATFRLYGKIFFDYNGNGTQEKGEPPVPNVVITLDGLNVTFTNSTGWYVISGVQEGTHRVRPFPSRNFRYMCESMDEFRLVTEYYNVTVRGDTRKDIGLMEGFLTLPFPNWLPITVDGSDYFDHDPGLDAIWWDGSFHQAPRPHNPPHTHPGTDFYMPTGTILSAAVSGTVSSMYVSGSGQYWISVKTKYGYGYSYIHISRALVSVGTSVKRGQPIALSGETGPTWPPHTEFQLWKIMPEGRAYCIDPYSPVAGVPRGAWIERVWEWYPSNEEWVSQGYWTKFNDPQYYA